MEKFAREIKVTDKELSNKKVSIKIGAAANREAPKTIYLSISFWIRPKKTKIAEGKNVKDILSVEIDRAFSSIDDVLTDNKMFPLHKRNILIKNIPENLAYNKKKNYINLELYLHTANLNQPANPFSLSKKEPTLYDSALGVANKLIENEFFNNKKSFFVFKKS